MAVVLTRSTSVKLEPMSILHTSTQCVLRGFHMYGAFLEGTDHVN